MKYKVGQKVKIVSCRLTPSHGGCTGIIKDNGHDGNWSIALDGEFTMKEGRGMMCDPSNFDDIEPIEETKFKVGDRVKQIKPSRITGKGVGDWTIITKIIKKDSETWVHGVWYHEDGTPYEKNPNSEDGAWRIQIDYVELLTDENPKKESEVRKNMTHEYKIGDKVRVLNSSGGHGFEVGSIVTLEGILWASRGSAHWYFNDSNIELYLGVNETMVNVMKLTKAQKEAWSKDQQALYRVGLVDANGEFVGSDSVAKATARANKSALVAQAEADIKEFEDSEKTKKS